MIDQHQRLMTSYCPAELAEFYRQCVKGDQEAWEFLLAYQAQAHRVDDFIDEVEFKSLNPVLWSEAVLAFTRSEQVVWSMPFYRRHEAALNVVGCLCRSLYGNSTVWATADHEGLRKMGDTLRFAGNLMVEACAMLIGGYEHQRDVSKMLWSLSWKGHHTEDGKPV